MKKFYLNICLGLLGTLVMTSCGEDEIINTNTGGNEAEALTDYTVSASNDGNYAWNANDAFTLWNRNTGKGYNFAISPAYDGSTPAAQFSGKAALQGNPQILAVFPGREAAVFSELSSFLIPDTCLQPTPAPALEDYAYMTATAEVKDNRLPDLTFSPLTATLRFNLRSISDKTLKIRYITLEGEEEIFPRRLTISNNGAVASLSGRRTGITLDMNEQELAPGETLEGFLNLFATTTGEENYLRSGSALAVTVAIWNGDIEQTNEVWSGTVREFPLTDGTMEETAYQFLAGRHYEINVNVDDALVPDEGYSVDEKGNVHIYNEKGLRGWAAMAATFGSATVSLEKDYFKDGTITLTDSWAAVPEFSGVFEGNGVTIENATILSTNNNVGFISVNKGTVKDLVFADMRLTSANGSTVVNDNANGIIVARNEGKILNCLVKGGSNIEVRGNDGNTGLLVGFNTESGLISGCSVEGGTLNVTTGQRAGGLAGLNHGEIAGSLTEGVSITYSGSSANACIGGLVGLNSGGKVTGCKAQADMNLQRSCQAGGLVGSAGSDRGIGQIGGSYATGNMTVAGNWIVGGLLGHSSVNGVKIIGCYASTSMTGEGTLMGIAPADGSIACSECYFLNAGQAASGATAVTAEELKGKAAAMNAILTGSGFKFTENPAASEREPLILQSAEPGAEGPGFGEGGEI